MSLCRGVHRSENARGDSRPKSRHRGDDELASTNDPSHAIAIKYPATNEDHAEDRDDRRSPSDLKDVLVSSPADGEERKMTPISARIVIMSTLRPIREAGPMTNPRYLTDYRGCFKRSKISA